MCYNRGSWSTESTEFFSWNVRVLVIRSFTWCQYQVMWSQMGRKIAKEPRSTFFFPTQWVTFPRLLRRGEHFISIRQALKLERFFLLFFFSGLFLKILIVNFPLPFSPLISPPLPQQSLHCCPCPWLLFPFCSIPPPPNHSPSSCHLLSIYESVSVLPVSSVHLIPHMTEIIWYLSFFTWLI